MGPTVDTTGMTHEQARAALVAAEHQAGAAYAQSLTGLDRAREVLERARENVPGWAASAAADGWFPEFAEALAKAREADDRLVELEDTGAALRAEIKGAGQRQAAADRAAVAGGKPLPKPVDVAALEAKYAEAKRTYAALLSVTTARYRALSSLATMDHADRCARLAHRRLTVVAEEAQQALRAALNGLAEYQSARDALGELAGVVSPSGRPGISHDVGWYRSIPIGTDLVPFRHLVDSLTAAQNFLANTFVPKGGLASHRTHGGLPPLLAQFAESPEEIAEREAAEAEALRAEEVARAAAAEEAEATRAAAAKARAEARAKRADRRAREEATREAIEAERAGD